MKRIVVLAVAGLLSCFAARAEQPEWKDVPKILSRIKPPHFHARNFDITQYGAVPDGQTDSTAAIAKAVDACAAADSVEGQLRTAGKGWIKATGEIKAGSYVQDILEGRLNQPLGRGAIGKVVYVAFGDGGQLDAMVDFGRGYRVGIHESELSLVNIE
ncbi:MAG TPA: hypothetical protein VK811_01455 [Candidatus Acidoferrum sp.]|jgi:hypothetical protein|nr:hypothetical protein [Candidatus Acidoferrum sp.]